MLTHQTALGFWRSEHACKAMRFKREGSGSLVPRAVSAFDASAVRELASSGDGAVAAGTSDAAVLPIYLLVSCDSGRHRAKGVAVHTCRSQLPPSALFAFQVDGLGKVGVVSPEVCLGQLSRSLTFEETLLLAFELRGTYWRVGAPGRRPRDGAGGRTRPIPVLKNSPAWCTLLPTYPIGVYCKPKGAPMAEECKCHLKDTPRSADLQDDLQKRLNRAIGQLNGVKAMIEDNRYCGDVLIQLAAAEKAIHRVSELVLRDHLHSCVVEQIQAGNEEVVDEVMELLRRFV